MRHALALVAALAPLLALPQPAADPELVAPQVTVAVRKHSMGADLVSVAMVSADYPPELLRAQCERVGQATGSPVRGLEVRLEGPREGLRIVRASFATDGLIDRLEGELRLEPLVRAFLGAPAPHTVTSFLVLFPGEQPVEGKTLQDYRSDVVSLKARAVASPPGIECRIVVGTQDPALLTIPSRFVPDEGTRVERGTPPGPNPVLVGLLVLAGLAAGALVYSLLVRSSGRRHRSGR